ncbi:MAG: hypothetical protein U5L98_15120 [Halomonas sp.]|nr:hypothetical protein [Halomonas sp.]MDZ7853931.1 hypothetical protein [Halomonas sp.]
MGIALLPAMLGFDLPVMIAVATNTLKALPAPPIDAAASLCQSHV